MIHRSTFLLLFFPMLCLAWSPSLRSHTYTSTSFRAPNFMSSEENFPDEMSMPGSAELTNNPCWQDIYDDDCSMSNIYAANFVASKWIKSMPCGAGIEDCDMPADLQVPAAHQDLGIEKTDVMAFLGLKRAASVNNKPETE